MAQRIMKILNLLLCTVLLCGACMDDDRLQTQPGDTRAMVFEIGEKPSFSNVPLEGTEGANTRLAENADLTMTWEKGDKIYLQVTFTLEDNSKTEKYATVTYNGTKWEFSEVILYPEKTKSAVVNGYHAAGTFAGNKVTLTPNTNIVSVKSVTLTPPDIASPATPVQLTFSPVLTRIEVKNAKAGYISALVPMPTAVDITKSALGNKQALTCKDGSIASDGVYYVSLDDAGTHTLTCRGMTMTLKKPADTYAGLSYTIDCNLYKPGIVTPGRPSRGIKTADDLIDFAKLWKAGDMTTLNQRYIVEGVVNLLADIDMTGRDDFEPCSGFNLVFDGQGHSITGWEYDKGLTDVGYSVSIPTNSAGLFHSIEKEGVVKNLVLEIKNTFGYATSLNSDEKLYLGCIAGKNEGLIMACTMTQGGYFSIVPKNDTQKAYVGGIAGGGKGTIVACIINDMGLFPDPPIEKQTVGAFSAENNVYSCLARKDIDLFPHNDGLSVFYTYTGGEAYNCVKPKSSLTYQPGSKEEDCVSYTSADDLLNKIPTINAGILKYNTKYPDTPCNYHYYYESGKGLIIAEGAPPPNATDKDRK